MRVCVCVRVKGISSLESSNEQQPKKKFNKKNLFVSLKIKGPCCMFAFLTFLLFSLFIVQPNQTNRPNIHNTRWTFAFDLFISIDYSEKKKEKRKKEIK